MSLKGSPSCHPKHDAREVLYVPQSMSEKRVTFFCGLWATSEKGVGYVRSEWFEDLAQKQNGMLGPKSWWICFFQVNGTSWRSLVSTLDYEMAI